MANGASNKAVVVLLLIAIGGAGALAWYVKNDPNAARVTGDLRRPDEAPAPPLVRQDQTQPSVEEQPKPTQAQTVELPVIRDGKLSAETAKADVPYGKDPKLFLAEEIVKAVKLDNAQVLNVDVRNGTAVINFGKGVDGGMGSDQEGLFLSSLQQGFAQFPEVKNLELDMEGQKLDSIGGHIDLSEGLPVGSPAAPSGPKPSEP
jgi:hypothetical protein